jgi:5-hydroxyisourate hydrolase
LGVGRYPLTIHVAEYFCDRDVVLPPAKFLDETVFRLDIADSTQHHHVPLLILPWSYSTYLGS